jgi:hypothetical protein
MVFAVPDRLVIIVCLAHLLTFLIDRVAIANFIVSDHKRFEKRFASAA